MACIKSNGFLATLARYRQLLLLRPPLLMLLTKRMVEAEQAEYSRYPRYFRGEYLL